MLHLNQRYAYHWESLLSEYFFFFSVIYFYFIVQLLITGGYDNGLQKLDQRVCFYFIVGAGVVLISTLIGLISDSVKVHMEGLSEGTTKVIERNHTVILGWNQSTIRVLVQIAHLRRVYYKQNSSWKCFCFPWLKVSPSSPVVNAVVSFNVRWQRR